MNPNEQVDYKELENVIAQAREMCQFQRNFIEENLNGRGFIGASIEVDVPILESMDPETVKAAFSNHFTNKVIVSAEAIDTYWNRYRIEGAPNLMETVATYVEDYTKYKSAEDKNAFVEDDFTLSIEMLEAIAVIESELGNIDYGEHQMEYIMAAYILRDAIMDVGDVISSEVNLHQMEALQKDSIDEYINYLASPEYDQDIEKRIADWKQEVIRMKEDNANGFKIRELEKSIYAIENRYTLAFMVERIFNDSTSEKEIRSIADSFFNNHTSSYNMQRYAEKCRQAKVDDRLYRSFFDVEYKFLEEKYHVFNNLFLFITVRYIGHLDVNKEFDKFNYIVNAMSKLMYNRFSSDAMRDSLLDTIRKTLDKFESYREKFEKDNILHPNHPAYKEKAAKREAATRNHAYNELAAILYPDVNSETDVSGREELKASINNMSVEEVVSYYNKVREIESSKADIYNKIIQENLVDMISGEYRRMSREELEAWYNEHTVNADSEKSDENGENSGNTV